MCVCVYYVMMMNVLILRAVQHLLTPKLSDLVGVDEEWL